MKSSSHKTEIKNNATGCKTMASSPTSESAVIMMKTKASRWYDGNVGGLTNLPSSSQVYSRGILAFRYCCLTVSR